MAENIFEKSIYLGLGVLNLTREKAQEIIDDLVERGKVSKDESSKAVRDLMNRAEKEKAEWEKSFNQSVEKTVKNLHLATKDDIEAINKRLDKMAQSQKSSS